VRVRRRGGLEGDAVAVTGFLRSVRAAVATIGCIGLMLAGAPLHAQVSGSIGVASDYRYRGLSLSEGMAAPLATLNVDTASGVYAGVAASRARVRLSEADAVITSYAGIALPLGRGMAWEVGANETVFHRAARYNYPEIYAGLNGARLGARLYYTPRYLGVGGRMAYGEVNGNWPLTEHIDVIAHGGYLHSVGAAAAGWGWRPAPRADARVGVAMAFEAWSAQLAYSVTRDGAALYPGAYGGRPRGLVLSIVRTF
jgi:uncharacterized protein (TIGR02001 family)